MSDEELSREIVEIRHRLKRLEELIAGIQLNLYDLQVRMINQENK